MMHGLLAFSLPVISWQYAVGSCAVLGISFTPAGVVKIGYTTIGQALRVRSACRKEKLFMIIQNDSRQAIDKNVNVYAYWFDKEQVIKRSALRLGHNAVQ